MEESQPTFVPPRVRIPQVPPQQVAGNRRVYIAPRASRSAHSQFVVPQRPVPDSGQEMLCREGMVEHFWSAQPAMLPQTPRPRPLLFNSQARRVAAASAETQYVTAVPRTPPLRIPAESNRRLHRAGPTAGEMLLGCAILLLLAVLGLAIMFFLLV